MKILFSEEIKAAAPDLKVIAICCDVKNPPTQDTLWEEIVDAGKKIHSDFSLDQINKRPAIAATRRIYKALGKEPNRYRPSAEALCRRMVNGKGLYRLTALVDIINLVSMQSGYSIGGFDADKIVGNKVILGVGKESEPFNAIGRGNLNIHCLPVYRDEVGPIGTPTSDVERTSLSESTVRLLMLINVYGEELSLDNTIDLATKLLINYASARNIQVETIK